MEKKKNKKRRKGTLIELLAILTILAIATVLFIPDLLLHFSNSNLTVDNARLEEIIKEDDYILDCSNWNHSEWNITKKCETGKYISEDKKEEIKISIVEFNNPNDTNNYYNLNTLGDREKGVGDKLDLKVERHNSTVIKKIKTNNAVIEFTTINEYEKEIDQIIEKIEKEVKSEK